MSARNGFNGSSFLTDNVVIVSVDLVNFSFYPKQIKVSTGDHVYFVQRTSKSENDHIQNSDDDQGTFISNQKVKYNSSVHEQHKPSHTKPNQGSKVYLSVFRSDSKEEVYTQSHLFVPTCANYSYRHHQSSLSNHISVSNINPLSLSSTMANGDSSQQSTDSLVDSKFPKSHELQSSRIIMCNSSTIISDAESSVGATQPISSRILPLDKWIVEKPGTYICRSEVFPFLRGDVTACIPETKDDTNKIATAGKDGKGHQSHTISKAKFSGSRREGGENDDQVEELFDDKSGTVFDLSSIKLGEVAFEPKSVASEEREGVSPMLVTKTRASLRGFFVDVSSSSSSSSESNNDSGSSRRHCHRSLRNGNGVVGTDDHRNEHVKHICTANSSSSNESDSSNRKNNSAGRYAGNDDDDDDDGGGGGGVPYNPVHTQKCGDVYIELTVDLTYFRSSKEHLL